MAHSAGSLPSRLRRLLRIAAVAAILLLAGAALLAGWGWHRLRGSLAILDGERPLAGLTAPVRVDRDALGVPSVSAASAEDAARALGFLHAQERFFQMDLLRRQPAGELSELFGSRALDADRSFRRHRFRLRARRAIAEAPAPHRQLLEAYADGVNEGLRQLRDVPWEYIVLRSRPEPWKPEDSLLTAWAMYLVLQDDDGSGDSSHGLLREVLPEAHYAFFAPAGTSWDAAIDGTQVELPPIPATGRENAATLRPLPPPRGRPADDSFAGSNSFAIDRTVSADGRAILAGDMHLGIDVPIIWYRASLVWPDEGGALRRVTGVTLPGLPVVLAGSNGEVAWSFTNSYGDWVDLVVLEEEGDGAYRTSGGVLPIGRATETIRVKGAVDETLEIEETIWGPVIDRDHRGVRRALRWVAHDSRAIDMNLSALGGARSLEEALDIANRSAMPAQNFVAVDRSGRIGWTIIGAIPRRTARGDHRLPASWSEQQRWDGWLSPEEYPRVVDPPGGRIWTANNRVVGGEMFEAIGNGRYDIGARALQIRDRLAELRAARERDLLAIQLDDEARFLARWQKLLLSVLSAEAIESDPRRGEMRRLVERWSARASVESAGYRFVRAFRSTVEEEIFDYVTAPAKELDGRFRWQEIGQREHALWELASKWPDHLRSPRFASWDEQLLAAADRAIELITESGAKLDERSWGERNTSRFRHPLAGSIPLVGRRLEYGPHQLPGDSNMPRVQSPREGASQRMVVSPGREEEGIFHMPGGQSGHPLSPHFSDGHDAWVRGEPTRFLPGETMHRLTLMPAAAAAPGPR
jgi:penicillin G amidase